MTALAAAITGLAQPALVAAFIVFLRVGAAMALIPAFGETAVPVRVRLGLALAFTAIVAPAVAGPSGAGLADPNLIRRSLLTEPLAGLCFGAVLRIWMLALTMAGSVIAQTTTLAQMFGAAAAEPAPAVSRILTMAGLALAVSAGLHVRLAEALIATYDILPPGTLPPAEGMRAWGLAQIAGASSLAFGLAMPFVIASLVYALAAGVMNRAMPQLMVSLIGAPAQALGAIALMLIGLPVALSVWLGAFEAMLGDPFGLPR